MTSSTCEYCFCLKGKQTWGASAFLFAWWCNGLFYRGALCQSALRFENRFQIRAAPLQLAFVFYPLQTRPKCIEVLKTLRVLNIKKDQHFATSTDGFMHKKNSPAWRASRLADGWLSMAQGTIIIGLRGHLRDVLTHKRNVCPAMIWLHSWTQVRAVEKRVYLMLFQAERPVHRSLICLGFEWSCTPALVPRWDGERV